MASLPSSERYSRDTARGSIRVFLANATFLPTGLATAAVLTRGLGPDGYGLFTLAATLISLVSWTLAATLERTSIALVAGAEDWPPVAAAIVRVYFFCGVIAVVSFWLGADVMSSFLSVPALAPFLRLFAFELMVFAPAQAYGAVLEARGLFVWRAVGTACRWIARMILMVTLVASGLSVTGAILGSIGGFLVELFIYRKFVRLPRLFGADFPTASVWKFGAPLMLFGLSMRLLVRLDLLALKALGGSLANTGVYGAAQNLAIAPTLIASSFAPFLLGTLTRMELTGKRLLAQTMVLDSLTFSIGLLPFALAAAGAADEVVVFLFGAEFLESGPILARLIVAESALVIVAVGSAALIVEDRRVWLSRLGTMLVVTAVAGHLFAVPRFGTVGAANVTAAISLVSALIVLVAVQRSWNVSPSVFRLLRTAAISAISYYASACWHTPGFWVALKLALICLGIALAYAVLGDLGHRERRFLRDLVRDVLRLGGPEGPAGDRDRQPNSS